MTKDAPAESRPEDGSASRRGFLLGSGAAVVAAAGVGAGAAFLTHEHSGPSLPPNPPAALTAAAQAERDLIAAVDRATGAHAAPAASLALLRANHTAHLQAIEAAIALVGQPSTSPTSAQSTPTITAGPPITRDQLRNGELTAATAAAATAILLTGADATLLASIAACEGSHAELLA